MKHDSVLRLALTLYGKSMGHLFLPQRWKWDFIFQSLIQIGIGSFPMMVVSAAIAGIVVTQEIAWHMQIALHSVSMIPGFSGQFIMKELGVAIPILLLVSRVGASIAAEIGIMKITEQLEAMRLLKINVFDYFIFPKFIASCLAAFCFTICSLGFTLICSLGVGVQNYGFTAFEFLNKTRHFIQMHDLLCAVMKGCVFGSLIPIWACAYGLRCENNAGGVGRAATRAVVTTTMSIILLDFLLTYLFNFLL